MATASGMQGRAGLHSNITAWHPSATNLKGGERPLVRHVGGAWSPGQCHDVDHWPASFACASAHPSSAPPAQLPSRPLLKARKMMLGAGGRRNKWCGEAGRAMCRQYAVKLFWAELALTVGHFLMNNGNLFSHYAANTNAKGDSCYAHLLDRSSHCHRTLSDPHEDVSSVVCYFEVTGHTMACIGGRYPWVGGVTLLLLKR